MRVEGAGVVHLEVRVVELVEEAAHADVVRAERQDGVERLPCGLVCRVPTLGHAEPVLVAPALDVGILREDSGHDLLHLRGIPVRRLLRDDVDRRSERRRLALLPALGEGVPREAAEERDLPGLDLVVHDVRPRLAGHAGVLTDDRQVVLAGIADVAPGIRRNGDSGVGRLLHHRDHGVAEVRIGDDHVDTLGDRRFPVGERLVEVRRARSSR